eukprot:gene9689-8643_t
MDIGPAAKKNKREPALAGRVKKEPPSKKPRKGKNGKKRRKRKKVKNGKNKSSKVDAIIDHIPGPPRSLEPGMVYWLVPAERWVLDVTGRKGRGKGGNGRHVFLGKDVMPKEACGVRRKAVLHDPSDYGQTAAQTAAVKKKLEAEFQEHLEIVEQEQSIKDCDKWAKGKAGASSTPQLFCNNCQAKAIWGIPA